MKYFYSLRISVADDKKNLVTEILNVTPTSTKSFWCLDISEDENDEPVYFISYFVNILESKFKDLESIGIERDNITIWKLYEYDGQCNMEFDPQDLLKLGENGEFEWAK